MQQTQYKLFTQLKPYDQLKRWSTKQRQIKQLQSKLSNSIQSISEGQKHRYTKFIIFTVWKGDTQKVA